MECRIMHDHSIIFFTMLIDICNIVIWWAGKGQFDKHPPRREREREKERVCPRSLSKCRWARHLFDAAPSPPCVRAPQKIFIKTSIGCGQLKPIVGTYLVRTMSSTYYEKEKENIHPNIYPTGDRIISGDDRQVARNRSPRQPLQPISYNTMQNNVCLLFWFLGGVWIYMYCCVRSIEYWFEVYGKERRVPIWLVLEGYHILYIYTHICIHTNR